VAGGVEVPGGVFVLRAVTTPHVPANLTEAQMYPRVPDLQAVLTAIRARTNLVDFGKMLAQAIVVSVIVAPFTFVCRVAEPAAQIVTRARYEVRASKSCASASERLAPMAFYQPWGGS
jgi:hypothetical protein